MNSDKKQWTYVAQRKMLRKYVQNLDSYGYPFQLRLKKNEDHRTFFGGIVTIVVFALTIVYLYQQLYSFFSSKVPILQTSILFNDEPKTQVLNLDKFFFAFAIEDRFTFSEYIDETIFNVRLEQCQRKLLYNNEKQGSETNQTCTELPLTRCNYQEHIIIKGIKPFFRKRNMENYFCLDVERWRSQPPVIQGTFDNDVYKWLQFSVSQCQNTSTVICKSQEQIKQKLGAGYFEVFISDQLAEYSQSGNPYVSEGRSIFDSFSFSQTKEYTMYFREMSTESEDGLLFNQQNDYQALAYSDSQILTSNFLSEIFLKVVLRLDTKKEFTQRTYDKLQDIFGIVGGLWSILNLVASMMVRPINRLDFEIKLLNKLFNFEVCKLNQNENKTSPSNVNNQIQLNDDSMIISKVKQELDLYLYQDFQKVEPKKKIEKEKNRQMLKRINNFLTLKFGKIKFFTHEYILYYFKSVKCANNLFVQRNQIKFALRKLNQELDIRNLLNKLKEFEKLKLLLMDEDEIKLFQFFPKPCIPYGEDGQIIKQQLYDKLAENVYKRMKYAATMHEQRSLPQKAIAAYQAYDNITKRGLAKNEKTQFKSKLWQFIDPQIITLFEKLSFQNNQININITNEVPVEDQIKSMGILQQTISRPFVHKQNLEVQNSYSEELMIEGPPQLLHPMNRVHLFRD